MLTMYVDQLFTKFPERSDIDWVAINIAPRAAVLINNTAQYAGIWIFRCRQMFG